MSLAEEFARLAEAAAPPHDNSLEAKNTRWAVYDFAQEHRDEIARALRLREMLEADDGKMLYPVSHWLIAGDIARLDAKETTL